MRTNAGIQLRHGQVLRHRYGSLYRENPIPTVGRTVASRTSEGSRDADDILSASLRVKLGAKTGVFPASGSRVETSDHTFLATAHPYRFHVACPSWGLGVVVPTDGQAVATVRLIGPTLSCETASLVHEDTVLRPVAHQESTAGACFGAEALVVSQCNKRHFTMGEAFGQGRMAALRKDTRNFVGCT